MFHDIHNAPIDSIATLIYWNDVADKEKIEAAIQKLKDEGLLYSETTKEYRSEWGGPVWYIP